MTLPPAVRKSFARFDAMSLRERALLSLAALAALVMIWTISVFDPIAARQRHLASEMSTLQESIAATAQSLSESESSPAAQALASEKKLQAELESLNAQLASKSGGLIPPDRMVRVIHDVLSRQRGVRLVSLHNKPMTALVQSLQADAPAPATGPYVHPVELVVEGRYLDLLDYLQALERLPWRFQWQTLELTTTEYPLNRVRIELSTLSMDRDWIAM
jgi:MSHA biogenesis protein MshJ